MWKTQEAWRGGLRERQGDQEPTEWSLLATRAGRKEGHISSTQQGARPGKALPTKPSALPSREGVNVPRFLLWLGSM